jgi:nitroreductase
MTLDARITDQLLTTTRTVRRRLDLTQAVPEALLAECLEIALQAPMSAGKDHWGASAFVVVTDPDLRQHVAEYYRSGMRLRLGGGAAPDLAAGSDDARRFNRVYASSMYLAEHLEQVPALVIPCMFGRPEGEPMPIQAAMFGSVVPAAWSFMLAARSRGLGVAWTTVHLFHEREVAALLGIPDDWCQVALLPVAFYTGVAFSLAARPDLATVVHWNGWTRP